MEADAEPLGGKRKKLASHAGDRPHHRGTGQPALHQKTVSKAQNPSTANPVKSGRTVPSNCRAISVPSGPRRC
jgi:hypothetical protein